MRGGRAVQRSHALRVGLEGYVTVPARFRPALRRSRSRASLAKQKLPLYRGLQDQCRWAPLGSCLGYLAFAVCRRGEVVANRVL